ncbi:MAG: transporter substrate-binding domain-containing protein [Rhodanobacteraceae bacterium]
MIRPAPIVALIAVCLLSCASVAAQAPASTDKVSTGQTLVVGVKLAPPFVIKDGQDYQGLAIDLWQEVAADHGWTYTYKPYDLEGLLQAVQHGQVDVGLGAITATAEREKHMDFAHPLTSSGLGVAVRKQGGSGWLAVVQALVSPAFLKGPSD